MATIILILCLLVMGTFYSLAFLYAFQKKKTSAFFMLAFGLISSFFFYYGIYNGWIVMPKQV